MTPRLKDPAHVTISTPSRDAVKLLSDLLKNNQSPSAAEVGVGVGATTFELCRLMEGRGSLHLFDFENALTLLAAELGQLGMGANVVMFPNGRKTYDSYNWSLAKLLRDMRRTGKNGIYDFVYLDGAHAFHHDAPAALIFKELLRPGGVLLFDDYRWTFANSATLNPTVNKTTAANYTEEQITTPHIALVCELFFDHDRNFSVVDIGYGAKEARRAYRKAS